MREKRTTKYTDISRKAVHLVTWELDLSCGEHNMLANISRKFSRIFESEIRFQYQIGKRRQISRAYSVCDQSLIRKDAFSDAGFEWKW